MQAVAKEDAGFMSYSICHADTAVESVGQALSDGAKCMQKQQSGMDVKYARSRKDAQDD